MICQFCIDCDGTPRFLAKDYEWPSYFAPKGTVKRHELVPSTATCPFNQPCHLLWRSEFCLIPCDRGNCVGTGNSCKKRRGVGCDRIKRLRTISRTAHSTSSTTSRVGEGTYVPTPPCGAISIQPLWRIECISNKRTARIIPNCACIQLLLISCEGNPYATEAPEIMGTARRPVIHAKKWGKSGGNKSLLSAAALACKGNVGYAVGLWYDPFQSASTRWWCIQANRSGVKPNSARPWWNTVNACLTNN
ncbi:hypothetical protein EDD17DRAFT_1677880 [Pisolithus thermaeus]|nr:hypothetical protein EDD17DRAFT_1677880 [Pisolithus thermaeus]